MHHVCDGPCFCSASSMKGTLYRCPSTRGRGFILMTCSRLTYTSWLASRMIVHDIFDIPFSRLLAGVSISRSYYVCVSFKSIVRVYNIARRGHFLRSSTTLSLHDVNYIWTHSSCGKYAVCFDGHLNVYASVVSGGYWRQTIRAISPRRTWIHWRW